MYSQKLIDAFVAGLVVKLPSDFDNIIEYRGRSGFFMEEKRILQADSTATGDGDTYLINTVQFVRTSLEAPGLESLVKVPSNTILNPRVIFSPKDNGGRGLEIHFSNLSEKSQAIIESLL
jgi:hypothetical protein